MSCPDNASREVTGGFSYGEPTDGHGFFCRKTSVRMSFCWERDWASVSIGFGIIGINFIPYRAPLKSLKSKRNRNNEGREPYCCLQPIIVESHPKNVDVAQKNSAQSKFYNKMLPS